MESCYILMKPLEDEKVSGIRSLGKGIPSNMTDSVGALRWEQWAQIIEERQSQVTQHSASVAAAAEAHMLLALIRLGVQLLQSLSRRLRSD